MKKPIMQVLCIFMLLFTYPFLSQDFSYGLESLLSTLGNLVWLCIAISFSSALWVKENSTKPDYTYSGRMFSYAIMVSVGAVIIRAINGEGVAQVMLVGVFLIGLIWVVALGVSRRNNTNECLSED